MTVKTYSIDGFVAALEHIIGHARQGRLVAASINLDPTGHGHYAFVLVDGQASTGDVELDPPDDSRTATTAPGKGQR